MPERKKRSLQNQAATLTFRRSPSDFFLIHDVFDAFLCCMHELRMYSLKLENAPDMFAALVAPGITEGTFARLVSKLLEEWRLVLLMESEQDSSECLGMLCPYTRYQPYRDLCTCLEMYEAKKAPETRQHLVNMASAYFPAIAYSSNVEQVFSHIQDSVNRAQKPDMGSMANLMSVALRAVEHRVSANSTMEHVRIQPEDWDGKATRGLKAKIWSPSSARPSDLAF